MSAETWPSPWLLEFITHGPWDEERELAERLLAHPDMPRAWAYLVAAMASDRAEAHAFRVLCAAWDEAWSVTTTGASLLPLKDHAGIFQEVARLARELRQATGTQALDGPVTDWIKPYRVPGTDDAPYLTDLLAALEEDASAVVADIQRHHPSPRTGNASGARRPVFKIFVRELARGIGGSRPFDRSALATLADAALGGLLDVRPVTVAAVKEALAGFDPKWDLYLALRDRERPKA